MPPKHQRVLNYVNRVRRALGKKPLKRIPKGNVCQSRSCPIAEGTGLPTGAFGFNQAFADPDTRAKLEAHGISRIHPLYVSDWITRFDDGRYPELIAS